MHISTPFLLSLIVLLSSIDTLAVPQLKASVVSQEASLWELPGLTPLNCQRATAAGNCKQMLKVLHAGDEVQIILDENGEPHSVDGAIKIGNQQLSKKFYQVETINQPGSKVQGWIAQNELTEIYTFESKEKLCPPVAKSTNTAQALTYQISEMQKGFEDKIFLGEQKSNSEIDRFMCLHHERGADKKQFKTEFHKFRKAAADASKAFGIPYALVMCTMLVESGLKHRPMEQQTQKEHSGYGQFGSNLVADITNVVERSPYSEMWAQFHRNHKTVQLTDEAIRHSSDPTVAAAAIALSLRWIYDERIPASGCEDCTRDMNLNRKDLYLLITGYNYGPYTISKVAKRTPSAIRTGDPPPEETRHYMTQMERCLAKGQEQNFREKLVDSSSRPNNRKCDL